MATHPAAEPAGPPVPRPAFRRLRGYAFDPSLSTRLETALMNETTFAVPWEPLGPGPVGEYLEIVDHDPASGCFYAPVELEHPSLLARDGLAPSEGNPQFHQQFVYAVAMTTIGHFERALGRPALWSAREVPGRKRPEYVQRLRIYPHAMREANAYYSPTSRALLFGYFPADARSRTHIPGGTVFTCLSHDIVAHETSHALLDGMHRRFLEDTNPDVLAFHEAFSDLVALFQHFTFPDVLRHQIARTRGDLATQNLLGELAQDFGEATGRYGALRSALGGRGADGVWRPAEPDPQAYRTVTEPHARGSLLVAAVFDGFLAIYRARVADLLRIATAGTGILPDGALSPDLAARLAVEASKAAGHVLSMCIRALDYCPPVDMTFGDYLRALVTADWDLVRDDDRGYRLAMIEAFRRRGLFPRDVRTLSEDALRWQGPTIACGDVPGICDLLRRQLDATRYVRDRREAFAAQDRMQRALKAHLQRRLADGDTFARVSRLVLDPRDPRAAALSGLERRRDGRPEIEVPVVRPARRVGPDGDVLNQAVVQIVQTRHLDPPGDEDLPEGWGAPRRPFRGGCTLIFDLDERALVYAVTKRVDGPARWARHEAYVTRGAETTLRATYFGPGLGREPFALLHADP